MSKCQACKEICVESDRPVQWTMRKMVPVQLHNLE